MWHKISWAIYVRQCLIAACYANREIRYIRGYLRKYFLKFSLNIIQLLPVYRITDIMYSILKQKASWAFKYTKGHAHDAHLFGVQESYFTTASLYVFRRMTHAVYCYKSSLFQIITPIYVLSLNLKYCSSHSNFVPLIV